MDKSTIKRLYDAGKLTTGGVANAVRRGWISAEDYAEITGEPYEVET